MSKRRRVLEAPQDQQQQLRSTRRRTLLPGEVKPEPRRKSMSRVLPAANLSTRLNSTPLKQEWAALDQSHLPFPVASKRKRSNSSDSSSSSSDPPAVKKMQANLIRRRRRRLALYVTEILEAKSQGLALLEKKAVQAKTEAYYTKEYTEFMSFVKESRLTVGSAASMDSALCQHMTSQFLAGHPSHKGDKLVAAVCHSHAQFSKHGPQSLPRTIRAMKGWRRLAPGQSRKAWPLAVWSAVAMEMVRVHQVRMALFTLTALASYARPSELLACKVFCLVQPTAQVTDHWAILLCAQEMAHPSKTGEYDDSVLLDNPYLLPWAKHLFKELKTQPKDQPLWDFGYSDHFHVFTQVSR